MTGTMTKRETKVRPWFEMEPFGMLRLGMDDLLTNVFGQAFPKLDEEKGVPRMDVSETENAVEVRTDVPGMKPEEIEIEVHEGALTIRGEHVEENKSEEKDRKYHRVERRTGSFVRSIWLPCAVDEAKVEAELAEGVLTIRLPKSAENRPHKVSIKS